MYMALLWHGTVTLVFICFLFAASRANALQIIHRFQ
jgi:hypothetical protein